MSESRDSNSIIREKQFAWFSAASATYLDLGLTPQQQSNLCIECLEVAKLHSDIKLYSYCIPALSSLAQISSERDTIQYWKELLRLAKVDGDEETEISFSLNLAYWYESLNAYNEAIWYIENALRIAHATNIGDKNREMYMYFQLMKCNFVLGQQDEVIKYGRMCLDIAIKYDNKEAEMNAYNKIGKAYLLKAEYDDAISYGKTCLDMAQRHGDKVMEMDAYIILGNAHANKEENDDALSYGKKCLRIAQEYGTKVKEINAYITLGNVHLNKEEYDDAISYGNKCLEMSQRYGEKRSVMYAYDTLSVAHMNKNEYEHAISYSNKCIAIAHACGDKDAEINAYIVLGNVQLKKGEYDNAISYAKTIIDIAQECGNKVAETNANCMLTNAQLHQQRYGKQEYDDAISNGKKLLEMEQGCRNKVNESNAYTCLGLAHLLKEEYDNAISYGEKCLIIAQGCSNKVGVINAYNMLGNAHLNKEEYDAAISYGKEYLIIAQGCDERVYEMNACLALGNAYLMKEEYDCSYTYLTQCMEIAYSLKDELTIRVTKVYVCSIYEAVGMSEELLRTSTIISGEKPIEPQSSIQENMQKWKYCLYHNFYLYHCSRGEYKNAIYYLEQAINVGPVKLGNGDMALCPDLLRLKINISDMYVLLGQYDKALRYYQETLDLARNRKYRKHSQAACHFGLGNVYYHLGELEKAEKSCKESIKCFEHIFDHLGQNDRFKIAIVDKYEDIYKMLLKVLVGLNKEKEALCLTEHVRARALKDLLVTRYGMKKDEIGKEDLRYTHVQALVSSKNYSLLVFSVCIGELYTFLVDKRNDLEFSVQHFEYCDEYFDKLVDKAFDGMQVRQGNNSENRPRSIDSIEEEIKEPNQKEDELTQLLRRRKENRSLERSRSARNSRGDPSENSDESSITNGLEILYQKLIGNVKCLIKQDEIVIIPEGPLYKVPFPALRDPETGQYLSESKRIRLAPSITTLKLIQEIPVDYHCITDALIIGDPLVGRVKVDGKEQYYERLEGAQEEAADISPILGVVPLYGGEATKPAVIKKLQEGVSVVHIAAHGSLSKATILLAPSPKIRAKRIPEEEDYMLTMADVQKLHVRAQLVVLSCCYSGRGDIRAEGVVGMCRAFLAAGARAVIGSLWAINDKATRKFMKTFYKYLKDGKSASTSLHLSMKDMRNKPRYSEPKYWAPFFLMGDDVTIQF